jgi:hypothetical protein
MCSLLGIVEGATFWSCPTKTRCYTPLLCHFTTQSLYYPVSLVPHSLLYYPVSLLLPSLSCTTQSLFYNTVSFTPYYPVFLLPILFTTQSLFYNTVSFTTQPLFYYPFSCTTLSLVLPSLFTTQSLLLQKLLHLAPRGCHEDFTTRRRQGPRCRPSAIRLPQGSGKGVGRGVGMWFRHVV